MIGIGTILLYLYTSYNRKCVPVYHNGLPSYLSEDLDVLQERGMRIIHPELSLEQALAKSDLCPLSTRRQEITDRLFQSIIKGNDHKLKKLLPDICKYNYNLRIPRKFKPMFKTNTFRDSSLHIHNSIIEALERVILS